MHTYCGGTGCGGIPKRLEGRGKTGRVTTRSDPSFGVAGSHRAAPEKQPKSPSTISAASPNTISESVVIELLLAGPWAHRLDGEVASRRADRPALSETARPARITDEEKGHPAWAMRVGDVRGHQQALPLQPRTPKWEVCTLCSRQAQDGQSRARHGAFPPSGLVPSPHAARPSFPHAHGMAGAISCCARTQRLPYPTHRPRANHAWNGQCSAAERIVAFRPLRF